MTNLVIRRNAKIYIMITLVVMAVVLSWFRPIDNFTEGYINNSIKTAGIIFGIARAINAAVSVTQSAEVGIGVATVAPGEALDPINDLIEQFSDVMMFAIASLAFQKILLGIAAHWIFSAFVTLSAVAFIVTLILRRHETTAFKTFAILVIVRLFLSVVILANSAVDSAFLDSQVQDGEMKIRLLEEQVSEASSDSMKQAQGVATNPAIDTQILEVDSQVQQFEDEKSELAGNITKLNSEIDTLKVDRHWWTLDILSKDPQVRNAKKRIKEIDKEVDEYETKLQGIEKNISMLHDKKECLQKQSRGDTCSWFDALSEYLGSMKNKFINAPQVVEEKIDDLITLMTLIVLRSILLPLFFWVLLFKTIKRVWAIRFQLKQT